MEARILAVSLEGIINTYKMHTQYEIDMNDSHSIAADIYEVGRYLVPGQR